jgi:hypothetical protein
VDATIVESARRKPTKAGRAEGTQGDPEAGYATRAGRAYYGFKAHVAADEEHTLIRSAELTAANVHDSRPFKDVCPADAGMAVADKAYASAAHERDRVPDSLTPLSADRGWARRRRETRVPPTPCAAGTLRPRGTAGRWRHRRARGRR